MFLLLLAYLLSESVDQLQRKKGRKKIRGSRKVEVVAAAGSAAVS